MGNSSRREARRAEGNRTLERRHRLERSDRGRDQERAASEGGPGARNRSSTQPTRRGPTNRTGPALNVTRQPIPQWVTSNTYASQPVPAELQESLSIKNHANLNKPSLTLIPARDGRFRIRFRVDCRVEAEVSIYLATREMPEADNAGVRFEPQHPRFANAVLPTQKLPAETDCTYTSPSINVRNYWKYLKYRPHQPHDYPIVISISYRIPDAEWEDLKAQASEAELEAAEPTPILPDKQEQSQFTYAEVVRHTGDDKPTEYSLKVLKQRLQLGHHLYDLEDIYGMPADSSPSVVSGASDPNAEPVTASLAGLETHDEGDDCVICLAEPRTTLVMPCRHMCLCADCASMLRQRTNKCPICRTVAERFLTLKKNKEGVPTPKEDSDSEGEVDFNRAPDPSEASHIRSSSASPSPTPDSSSAPAPRIRPPIPSSSNSRVGRPTMRN